MRRAMETKGPLRVYRKVPYTVDSPYKGPGYKNSRPIRILAAEPSFLYGKIKISTL